MIQHLIFDCDGVIVDSEILASEITVEMLQPIGYQSTALEHAHRFAGLKETIIVERIRQEDGVDVPEDFLHQVGEIFAKRFAAELKSIKGMPNLIRKVQLPKSVVSNSDLRSVISSTTRAGVRAYFGQRIFSAEMVAHPKPAPDVYLLAAQSIGIDPQDLLVIEDSPTGVEAAATAGLKVIGFVGAGHISPGHDARLRKVGALDVAKDAQHLEQMLVALGVGF
ncbi:MAG: HAD-IA family hydrolase [Bacteroidota bacterium]